MSLSYNNPEPRYFDQYFLQIKDVCDCVRSKYGETGVPSGKYYGHSNIKLCADIYVWQTKVHEI